ncbi:hypothetical protein DGM85_03755 [Xanthomonas phaseoli pv. phaseoli]|nr:hypothetical protein DGM93_18795 [Xanthomonas phaseoli pv. phaseoli]QWN27765.1 hypothetical protein DGM85_03755 [Xanthomonas phaseoli pv. phaseoli]QWN34397.1 hypothetical protein DGM81_18555 [Xanthomonas phaseoli pv. phaseoli]RWU14407.1 hypothetical protein XANMN_18550 [Xanthomonas phaseoli pv. manihotis str. CIO151]
MKERPHVRHRILRRTTTHLPDHTVLHPVMKTTALPRTLASEAMRYDCCGSVQLPGVRYAGEWRQAQWRASGARPAASR